MLVVTQVALALTLFVGSMLKRRHLGTVPDQCVDDVFPSGWCDDKKPKGDVTSGNGQPAGTHPVNHRRPRQCGRDGACGDSIREKRAGSVSDVWERFEHLGVEGDERKAAARR